MGNRWLHQIGGKQTVTNSAIIFYIFAPMRTMHKVQYCIEMIELVDIEAACNLEVLSTGVAARLNLVHNASKSEMLLIQRSKGSCDLCT